MRTLKFIVHGQKIKRDPQCDFSGIVLGTSGYLNAHFIFDSAWAGAVKAASFFCLGKEYAVLLNENDMCKIPAEALPWTCFDVGVTGKRNNLIITTNTCKVEQERRNPV
jgi:hypothetical protein